MWRFNLALQTRIAQAGSMRRLARQLKVSASMISRFMSGEAGGKFHGPSATLLGEALGVCPTCDGVWPSRKSSTAWVLTNGEGQAYWTGQSTTAMSGDLRDAMRFASIDDAERVRAGIIGPVDKSLSDRLVARVRFWSIAH